MMMAACTTDITNQEVAATEQFLKSRDEESFARVFRLFTPQLLSFFRTRGCESTLAEDLTQDVMLAVHRNISQVRNQNLFRAWLFTIARHAMYRHFTKHAQHKEDSLLDATIDHLSAVESRQPGTDGFEFREWIKFLDPPEQELMTLRFVEQWEYNEIAAAHAVPIGTVKWRVFNAKQKLALHLVAVRCSS